MSEETQSDRDALAGPAPAGSLGVLEVVRAVGTPWWAVRVTIAHADGPVSGWTPQLFDTPEEATTWIASRSGGQLRPAVRTCTDGGSSYAAVVDRASRALLLSAPVARRKAAGIAALLAAELRARD